MRDERLQRPLGVHVDEVEAALPRDDRQPEQIRAHHDARRGLVRLEDPRPRVCARHVFPRGGVVENTRRPGWSLRVVERGPRRRRPPTAPSGRRAAGCAALAPRASGPPGRRRRRGRRPPGHATPDVDAAAEERGGRSERDAQRPAPPRVRVPPGGHPGLPRLQLAGAALWSLRGGPGSLAGADFIKSSYN